MCLTGGFLLFDVLYFVAVVRMIMHNHSHFL